MRKRLFVFVIPLIALGFLAIILSAIPVQAENVVENVAPAGGINTDYIYTSWQIPAPSDFAFTRFDGEYSLETNHVYFLGGRLGDGSTDGSVWEFDPVTGVYTDTGVSLPTPISNYQIARLTDGTGDEVFVVFGGRPGAGGVTNSVQGYKPGSNTVVDYTSTDPLPVSTAPGGVSVVNNITYIYGGFDGASMSDGTYIFDIQAADGNRFTVGPDLGQARSYIPNAVVDGMIYALGGDAFDGSALLPLTITEKLDPTNLGAGWDNVGVADMPIACEEAPAFGFDTNAAYDLAGSIVIAGCGQWSDEINEVELYDVATDSWDTAFPDLNEARRNHGGAFIPNGDGTDGMPGMWIWGGRQGSDSNILVLPEYYSVAPLSDFTLLPREQAVFGTGLVTVTMGAANRSGADDVFDLSYNHSLGWTVTGPMTVSVADGETIPFNLVVDVPASAGCAQVNQLTVQGFGQINTLLTDTVQAVVGPFCPTGASGVIYDANTGLPIPNAYVYLENTANDQISGDAFADATGHYTATLQVAGDYYVAVSAKGYQFSVLPDGWPGGADVVTVNRYSLAPLDITMNAPQMEVTEGSMSVNLYPQEQITKTIVITNSGTSDLRFSISTDSGQMAPASHLPEPVMPTPSDRVDPRILDNLQASGTGQTDFIVYMHEQTDLSAAYDITDWDARGQYVYDALLATANRSQAEIRQTLDAKQVSYRAFVSANALLVKGGDLALVNQLAARTDVAFLLANDQVMLETIRPSLWQRLVSKVETVLAPETLTWGVQAVHANTAWSGGVFGDGIVVANIDTGVDWTHEALINQYRGGAGNHDYNWYMPTSGCAGETEPCDNDSHGSHTMGTMVGSTDPTHPLTATEGIGVAPGAQWIACKGCEGNGCSFEALLACGDWMVAPTDLDGLNPDPTKRPNIINNSWGGGGGDFWYGGVVAAWRASGMYPQFSGGNSGPTCSTSGSPGDYWLSYSAAAIDSSQNIASFSSRGPAAVTNLQKPDISGPGVAVRSSVPGNGYANFNGTSMASPHVAGVVALLWSARPELIGQIDTTMALLSETADPLYTTDTCGGDTTASHPNHTYGWGLVDASAAITNSMGIVLPWVEVNPFGGTVAPGEVMTVSVVFTGLDATGTYTGFLHLTADEPYMPEVTYPVELVMNVPAAASFTHNGPLTIGETAVFTNTSTGTEPISYLWDFGDGSTGDLQDPTHVYTASGTYTVTLMATNGVTSVAQDTVVVVSYDIYLPFLIKP